MAGCAFSLDEIAESFSRLVSPATLDRMLRLYHEYEGRVELHTDNLL